jgi:hypothetical protein
VPTEHIRNRASQRNVIKPVWNPKKRRDKAELSHRALRIEPNFTNLDLIQPYICDGENTYGPCDFT